MSSNVEGLKKIREWWKQIFECSSIPDNIIIKHARSDIPFLSGLIEKLEKQNENNADVIISILKEKKVMQVKIQSLEVIREKGIAIKDYLDHNVKPSPIIDEGLSIFKLLFEFEQAIQDLEKKKDEK